MAYKRAEWHSGLTYRQTCEDCKTTVIYMDDKLDFRPWFADGFVYCPKCKKPLRHREEYAIEQKPPQVIDQTPSDPLQPEEGTLPSFCSNCGKAFRAEDRFCSQCGRKRA